MGKYNDDNKFGVYLFLIGLGIAVILGVAIGIYNFLDNNSRYISNNHIGLFYLSILVLSIIFITVYFKQRSNYNTRLRDLEKELDELNSYLKKKEVIVKEIKNSMSEKNKLYESYKTLDINNISTLYADFLTLEYYQSAIWLENKEIVVKDNWGNYRMVKVRERIAKSAAETLKKYRSKTRFYIEQYKMMLYKYDVLLSLFPDLTNYVDNIETINLLSNFNNIKAFRDEHDRVRDYIPKEKYNKLDVNERNQLALDNYINGRKTNWQIGRDYEMYCASKYEEKGWKVERFGIEKGLNDMGRDLIATKGNIIHIIQCKFWSERKLIHEKHIAQLYGSTIEYSITHEGDLFDNSKERDLFTIACKIVPVFITNIDLSETAVRFANRLGVEICKWDIEEFPRIKCNVNNGEKIYHLPFDQQYDRTKIINEGESYEYTVKDAVAKGFRRAKKHLFTDK